DPSTGFKLDTSSNEAILKLFGNSIYIVNTIEKDTTTREDEALIEVFKKQRPGEPPTVENARNLLNSLFFDPKRYDLTKVGRYKLNQRLGVDVPEGTRVLTTQDILALVQTLVELPSQLGVPEDSKDYAAEAIRLLRDPARGGLRPRARSRSAGRTRPGSAVSDVAERTRRNPGRLSPPLPPLPGHGCGASPPPRRPTVASGRPSCRLYCPAPSPPGGPVHD